MIERRSYKNCGKNNKMQRKREKQVFLPLPFCVIPVLCPGGSFLLRQPLALCGLCPGRASVSDDLRAKENLQAAQIVRHPVRDLSEHGVSRASSTGQDASGDNLCRLIQILCERGWSLRQKPCRGAECTEPKHSGQSVTPAPIPSIYPPKPLACPYHV